MDEVEIVLICLLGALCIWLAVEARFYHQMWMRDMERGDYWRDRCLRAEEEVGRR